MSLNVPRHNRPFGYLAVTVERGSIRPIRLASPLNCPPITAITLRSVTVTNTAPVEVAAMVLPMTPNRSHAICNAVDRFSPQDEYALRWFQQPNGRGADAGQHS